MSVSQTFLRLQSPKDMRDYLYAVGETHGADHIERALVGSAVVWVDAQHLPSDQENCVWEQLQLIRPNQTPEDLLPYVFNLSVMANTPSALQRVCDHCLDPSETFTKVSQLLKNLQTFPLLPIKATDFCAPLLHLVTKPHHVKTLISIMLHGVHTRMVNNQTYTPDVMQCVVDYAVGQNVGADIMAELIFSSVSQWNLIAHHAPNLVQPLLSITPFKSALLYGGIPYHKCRSFDKWERFLIHGTSPLPLEMEDSGFPFNPHAHKNWLGFLDELIPLYTSFGHTIDLLEFKGLEEITRNQSGLTVNAYQKQKITEVVSANDQYVSKISKI